MTFISFLFILLTEQLRLWASYFDEKNNPKLNIFVNGLNRLADRIDKIMDENHNVNDAHNTSIMDLPVKFTILKYIVILTIVMLVMIASGGGGILLDSVKYDTSTKSTTSKTDHHDSVSNIVFNLYGSDAKTLKEEGAIAAKLLEDEGGKLGVILKHPVDCDCSQCENKK